MPRDHQSTLNPYGELSIISRKQIFGKIYDFLEEEEEGGKRGEWNGNGKSARTYKKVKMSAITFLNRIFTSPFSWFVKFIKQ